jgi:hypothetical protein
MSKWITGIYSNTALVSFKNLKLRWAILLYVLIIFMISAPFSVSLFTSRVTDYLKDPAAFESDFTKLVKSVDCQIDDKVELSCVESGMILDYPNYTIALLPASDYVPQAMTIVLGKTQMDITDETGTIVVSGTYDFLIGTRFTDLKAGILNKTIDATMMADNVLRSIVLSSFGSLALVRTVVMMVSTSMFVLVIAFFFRYISVKRPTVITYKQSFAIIVQSMFGPALLSAFVGMFLPEQSLLLFLLLFVIRFMWLYQDILHKKISLN